MKELYCSVCGMREKPVVAARISTLPLFDPETHRCPVCILLGGIEKMAEIRKTSLRNLVGSYLMGRARATGRSRRALWWEDHE